MKTISISISDSEYDQFGIKDGKWSFSDLLNIVNTEVSKQALARCISLAARYKLSKMIMDEISDEVRAVRNA